MAKGKKVQPAIEEIEELEIDDLEELEDSIGDLDKETEEAEEGEDFLSAKEAAMRIGTDGRTLRKFLRSPQGKGRLVGQGNRWAIDPDDLDELKIKFSNWHKPKAKEVKVSLPIADVDDDEFEDLDSLDED